MGVLDCIDQATGCSEGIGDGCVDGIEDGWNDGIEDGIDEADGCSEGIDDGCVDGIDEEDGSADGCSEGIDVGCVDGCVDGIGLGLEDGASVGEQDGADDGGADGADDGGADDTLGEELVDGLIDLELPFPPSLFPVPPLPFPFPPLPLGLLHPPTDFFVLFLLALPDFPAFPITLCLDPLMLFEIDASATLEYVASIAFSALAL